jgi:hypothetical protein
LSPVIGVPELVLSDKPAFAPRIEPGAKGLAVPPREDLGQKMFHRCGRAVPHEVSNGAEYGVVAG